MNTPVLRRSELTCPGHSLSMMAKAAASDADEVIFDLEDACAVSEKVSARATVAQALRTLTFTGEKVRAYRINGVDTAYCYRDLVDVLEAAGNCVDAIVVPKVRGPEDVHFVDRLVSQIEWAKGWPAGRIRLELLIESARGLLRAEQSALASPRVASLIFGIADFAGDVGSKSFTHEAQTQFAYPRAAMLIAARAAGIDAIDSVTVQFRDLEACAADAMHAASLGYDGKWAIHPSQLAPIHAAFTPTGAEIERAQKIMATYEQADRSQGLGAIVFEGHMVDAATLKVEARRLAIAQRAGLITKGT